MRLPNIPGWALEAFLALGTGIAELVGAKDDEGRIAALMQTQEDLKAALDKQKFGP